MQMLLWCLARLGSFSQCTSPKSSIVFFNLPESSPQQKEKKRKKQTEQLDGKPQIYGHHLQQGQVVRLKSKIQEWENNCYH